MFTTAIGLKVYVTTLETRNSLPEIKAERSQLGFRFILPFRVMYRLNFAIRFLVSFPEFSLDVFRSTTNAWANSAIAICSLDSSIIS